MAFKSASKNCSLSLLGLWSVVVAGGCELPAGNITGKTPLLVPGDVDGNGRVDIWDARSLDRALTSKYLRVPNPTAADVSQNGDVDRGDFEAIEKRAHNESTLVVSVDDDNERPVLIGGMVTIVAADTFLPLDVQGGSVRVTSAAADYDSGDCELAHVADGRSLAYHWDTVGLKPAIDYQIEVNLEKRPFKPSNAPELQASKAGPTSVAQDQSLNVPVRDLYSTVSTSPQTSSRQSSTGLVTVSDRESDYQQADVPSDAPVEVGAFQLWDPVVDFSRDRDGATDDLSDGPLERLTTKIQVQLMSRPLEFSVLAESVDLKLPFWELGLKMERRFFYTSVNEPVVGSFGRGWTHRYGLLLREHTDGVVDVLGADAAALSFRRNQDGSYAPIGNCKEKLVRDPDGSFQLFLQSGHKWRFDSSLQASSLSDGRGHTLRFLYESGLLRTVIDDAQQSLSITYNDDDLIVLVRDSLGRSVTYQYDELQNLVAVEGPYQEIQTYAYDSANRLLTVDRNGLVSRQIAYQADGMVEHIRGDGPLTVGHSVDAVGNGSRRIGTDTDMPLLEEITPDGQIVARKLGTDSKPIRFDYDDQNLVEKVVGPNSEKYSLVSDTSDNSRTLLELPDGSHMSWQLQPQQNATILTDANGIATRLRYLDNGQLTHIHHPDGMAEVRRYSETSTDRSIRCELRGGQTVQYTFDQRGLLLSIQANKDRPSNYAYDSRGNLTTAENAWGQLAFEYDDRSRVIACSYPGQRTIRYEYDEHDRRTAIIYPNNFSIRYVWDAQNRLTGVQSDPIGAGTELLYDPSGQRSVRKDSNGVQTGYGYTSWGALESISVEGPDQTSLANRTYAYDELGRRSGSKLTVPVVGSSDSAPTASEHVRNFQYDALGRLSQVASDGQVQYALHYDSAGNRLSDGARRIAANVMNQVSSIGDVRQAFDLNGNLNVQVRADQTKTAYEHDALHHLVRVRLPNQPIISYQYDALGRITMRTAGDVTTYYYWDGDYIIATETPARSEQQTFVWAASSDPQRQELIAFQSAGAWNYCGHDAQLSVTEVFNTEGKVAARLDYDAYGIETQPLVNALPFRFASALYDPVAEIYLMGSRWYQPSTGSYLEPHPLAPLSGIHPYAYAANDPVNHAGYDQKAAELLFHGEGKRSLPAEQASQFALSVLGIHRETLDRTVISLGHLLPSAGQPWSVGNGTTLISRSGGFEIER